MLYLTCQSRHPFLSALIGYQASALIGYQASVLHLVPRRSANLSDDSLRVPTPLGRSHRIQSLHNKPNRPVPAAHGNGVVGLPFFLSYFGRPSLWCRRFPCHDGPFRSGVWQAYSSYSECPVVGTLPQARGLSRIRRVSCPELAPGEMVHSFVGFFARSQFQSKIK